MTRQARDSSVGHYWVVISYTVNGEIYSGRFIDFGLQAEEYFHRGDTLTIRYNPQRPSKFYYPELRTQRRLNLIFPWSRRTCRGCSFADCFPLEACLITL